MHSDKNTRIEFIIERMFNMNSELNNDKLLTSNSEFITVNTGSFIKRNFKPDHPWLLNYGAGIQDSNDDRLLSNGVSGLLHTPEVVLGDSFEVIMLEGIQIKWLKYVKVDLKKLKGITTASPCCVYEGHDRRMNLDGENSYVKVLTGIKGFKPVSMKWNGQILNNENSLFLPASIKEDFYRVGVFHVKITNDDTLQGLRIACEPHEVIELMKYRNNPLTIKGNKKPVMHWVSKYLKGEYKKTKVESHVRGLGSFKIDGFTIEISKPEKYIHEFQAQ